MPVPKGYVRFKDSLMKSKLTKMHLDQKKSIHEIARSLKHKRHTISRYLDFYGIPKRSPREAMLAKMETDEKYRELITTRQRRRSKIHDRALREELQKLRHQGFRCIPIGLHSYPKPDIIAIKEGKVFAVEVELSHVDYGKYAGIEDFDDIIWIRRMK